MKPNFKLFLFFGTAGLIVSGVFWWRVRTSERVTELQSYEYSSSAFVVLSHGFSPFLAEVRAIDLDGNPVSGAKIDIRNNSGGNSGITDKVGYVSIKLAEEEIEQILLDGAPVLNRPNAYSLGYPSVKKGLRVLILKRSSTVVPQEVIKI